MNPIDWDGLKAEYRLGRISNLALGAKYGVTEGAIRKRAKKEEWPRDLSPAVERATKERLVREAVRVRRADAPPRTEEEVVADAVEANAQVVLGHRKDIALMSEVVGLLREQVLDAATYRQRIAEVITANTAATETAKRAAMMKAVSLPAHAGVIRDLTTAAKNLITLERQAFNIGQETGGGTLEDWLAKLEST